VAVAEAGENKFLKDKIRKRLGLKRKRLRKLNIS
jgi:hypothetical protein